MSQVKKVSFSEESKAKLLIQNDNLETSQSVLDNSALKSEGEKKLGDIKSESEYKRNIFMTRQVGIE